MKDTIKEITDAVKLLMKLSDKFERGQTIQWLDIERIAGDRKTGRARHIIGKWRKRLERDREIVTLCADNVGVRLLTHRETASEIPAIRQRKAYRQIRRAIKQTSLVNNEQLSLHERKLLSAQRANMVQQRLQLGRSRRQLAKGIVPTEGNPRRQMATA